MSIRDLHGALEVRQWVGRLSQHSILRVASIDDGVPACGAASLCWCVLAARTTTEGVAVARLAEVVRRWQNPAMGTEQLRGFMSVCTRRGVAIGLRARSHVWLRGEDG